MWPASAIPNDKLVTWFENGKNLSFWKLFDSKPFQSLSLPAGARNRYFLLPSRNLLILQTAAERQLLFLDINKNQVLGTANSAGAHLHIGMNARDRAITCSILGSYIKIHKKYYCYELTPGLELKELGTIMAVNRRRGSDFYASKVFAVCDGSTFLEMSTKGVGLVNLEENKKVLKEIIERPWGALCGSSVELLGHKRTVCLLTVANKLLILKIREFI